MNKHGGGAAFPGFNYVSSNVHDGMSLRDYFAAKAMQAMISKSNGQDRTGGKDGVPLIAKFAYEFADAMLEARKQ